MLSIVSDRGTDGGIDPFSAMICKHEQIITHSNDNVIMDKYNEL